MMNEAVRDPQMPIDGALFPEGFARWVELKVAHFIGADLHTGEIGRLRSQNHDTLELGFHILQGIEDRYGMFAVIRFVTEGDCPMFEGMRFGDFAEHRDPLIKLAALAGEETRGRIMDLI